MKLHNALISTVLYLLGTATVAIASSNSDAMSLQYQANSVCVLTNAVRFDSSKYVKERKAELQCTAPSGLGTLYIERALIESSKYHSDKMAEVGKMTHDTVGNGKVPAGSKFEVRIKQFFKKSEEVGENVGAGTSFKDPFKLMNAWLKSNLHCNNIMSTKYNLIGVASTCQGNKVYVTENFGCVPKNKVPTQAIACGSHFIEGDRCSFMVAVGALPSGATVNLVLNGQKSTMTLDCGKKEKGIYKVFGSPDKGKCNNYHFEVSGSGTNERYPVKGELQTEGWGQCKALNFEKKN